jgi:SAM-dependent methyltransferase
MTLVTASPSYAWFIEQGREESAMLRELAARYGRPFETAGAVLDFGCGCGRLARWIAPAVVARGAAFHGADINSELVSWCRANLPGDYRRNALKPPVPIEDGSIDLLYAMSVLTHLKVRTAQAWLDDFARVLKPGGLALVSFHDEDLAPAEIRPQLAHRDWVLTAEVLEGSNHMGAFTTRDVFARVCGRRFQVLEVVPSRPAQGHQALAVLRR